MTLTLPSNREERWRWSDLSALPQLAQTAPHGRVPDAIPFLLTDGPKLLFVDGAFDPDRSDPGPVTVGAPDVDGTTHPFARLAGVTGWRLSLGRAHAAPGLVQIVHVTTGGGDHLSADIRLAEDAQASVLETFVGAGWANRRTRVDLARSARLQLTRRLLTESGFVSLVDTVEIADGASAKIANLSAGGADTRLDADVRLTGPHAFAEVGGALLARGKQRHDANLVLHHAAPNGTSRQVWRSVADDRATCAVAARVEVARDAQKTDGEQSLRGLLLARTATINAKPELEIYADDVKCAHGATVGELDKQALFYL